MTMSNRGSSKGAATEGRLLQATREFWVNFFEKVEKVKTELRAKRLSKDELIDLFATCLIAAEQANSDPQAKRDAERYALHSANAEAELLEAVASSASDGWDPMELVDRALVELRPDHPPLLNLQAILEHGASASRRSVAKMAAAKKHANSPAAKSKEFIRSCWERWRTGVTKYPSAAGFARDMLEKQLEGATSEAVVSRWVREWDRAEK